MGRAGHVTGSTDKGRVTVKFLTDDVIMNAKALVTVSVVDHGLSVTDVIGKYPELASFVFFTLKNLEKKKKEKHPKGSYTFLESIINVQKIINFYWVFCFIFVTR